MTNARSPRIEESLRYWAVFAVAAAVAAGVVLTLSGGLSFWHDECDFLHHRSLAEPLGLFTPHNDHAVVIPAATYIFVLEMAGTNSYLPYIALLLVAHVITAAGVVALLYPNSPALATAGGILLLFFGAGSDNLFWAFQITFLASTAFGVWSLRAALHGRWSIAALLLIGSVFSSLVGAAFMTAALAIGMTRRDRRAAWIGLPLILLGAWWLAFGFGWIRPPDWAAYTYGSPDQLESWTHVPAYVLKSIVRTVGSISGLNLTLALFATLGLAALAVRQALRGWRPSATQVAASVGYLTFMTMAGVVRASNDAGLESRFLYVSAVFALMALPSLRRPLPTLLVGAAFVLGLSTNILELVDRAALWTARAGGPMACLP